MNESPKNIASYLLGLYVAVSNLGYAIGPAILTITGVESNIAFYVCIVIVLASSSPIAFINTSVELRRKPSKLEKDKLSAIFLFAREHPYIVLTSAAASFFDTCIMNMFPLFALSHGHSSETINSALFLFVIGGVASQIPISKFLNGFSPRKATFFLSIVLISLCLSLPHLPNPIYLLPVMCLIGGSVFSIQTCSLTTLSKEISDSARHVGNSSNAFFWALCNVVGIPLSGYLMKAFESSFLMYILIIPFLGVIYLSRKVADIRELAK